MIEPLVYILILNFNRSSDTVECINSLMKIEYRNYKILIVDNNSTDDSIKTFHSQFPKIEIINSKQNLGYTGGINFGLELILSRKSDYILVLNNDTIVDPGFLKELVESLESKPNAAVACGTILCHHAPEEIWYAGGKISKFRGLAKHKHKGRKFNFNSNIKPVATDFITGCMILFKSEVLSIVGLEDERFFMYLDDIELSLRIKRFGFDLLYVPNSIIYHKVLGEKENPLKLYYSVRNRLLLISSSFHLFWKLIASTYFLSIILLKIFYWNLFNKPFKIAAISGLKDYFRGNFFIGRGMDFYKKY